MFIYTRAQKITILPIQDFPIEINNSLPRASKIVKILIAKEDIPCNGRISHLRGATYFCICKTRAPRIVSPRNGRIISEMPILFHANSAINFRFLCARRTLFSFLLFFFASPFLRRLHALQLREKFMECPRWFRSSFRFHFYTS